MRMINDFKTRYKEMVSDKRGLTLIQVFFIIVIIIAITVMLNPIDLFNKATRGKETTGWATELTNLSNNVLSNRDRHKMMYSIGITNATPPYDLTVASPPVSAYNDIKTLVIEGTTPTAGRVINYSNNGTITYSDAAFAGTKLTTPILSDFKGNPITQGTTQLKGIAHAGSNGIAPFINKSIPKVEEALFLGMLGGQGTTLGKQYDKDGKFTGMGTMTDVPKLLELAFGSGEYGIFDFSTPNRWITLNLIDTKAMKSIVGGNSKFYDQSRYRLYWVSNIATEAEAMNMAVAKFGLTDTKNALELYNKMINNVVVDSIVVMPTDKNDMVYSEKSEFKLFKFTTAD